ncbi:MAG: hypothetical protein AAB472_03480 [Patescibacteria group bacterium]
MKEKGLIFVYETEQIPAVLVYLEEHPDSMVISLTLWVERELRANGVTSLPLTDFVLPTENNHSLLEQADTLAREWYQTPEMSFFSYAGMHLGEVLEPMLSEYFQRILYYLRAVHAVLAVHADRTLLVTPHSCKEARSTSGPLAPFEIRIVANVISTIGKQRSLSVQLLGREPVTPTAHIYPRSLLRSYSLACINACTKFLTPQKPLRIYASEYWWHVAPFIQTMDDAEVVFMERKELRNIPWTEIRKHRIRFAHPVDATSRKMRRDTREIVKQFTREWEAKRESVRSMEGFTYEGDNWWSLVEAAYEYLVTVYAERIVTDHKAFEALFKREHINRVLLRASVGGTQHHFFVAAQVARMLHIPSIELQHATEVVDAQSVHSRLAADYLASYGEATKENLTRNHGYDPNRIRAIGSPRFDSYTQRDSFTEAKKSEFLTTLGLNPEKPTLLYAVPSEIVDLYIANFDSYQIAHYFTELRAVQEHIPELQILAKFRGGALTERYRDFLTELFPDGGIVLSDSRDIVSLMRASTLVLAGNSTLFLEALQADCPTLLYPLQPHDVVTKQTYQAVLPAPDNADTLKNLVERLVFNQAERELLLTAQQAFLHTKYAFDGKASERIAALLREPLVSYPNDIA